LKVAIGADHGGVRLKDELVTYIKSLGHEVEDLGCDCATAVDYPDYALPVCERVQQGKADRGILICGTGIGMCCALVHDAFSAKATREHNDTNVLAMGERVIGPGYAQDIVGIWLGTAFSKHERHVNRINKISAIEANQ
jgi:ribose 5-phosphate isomerase B